jgi:hypothetical protein
MISKRDQLKKVGTIVKFLHKSASTSQVVRLLIFYHCINEENHRTFKILHVNQNIL